MQEYSLEDMELQRKKASYDLFYLYRDVMRSGSFQKAAKDMGNTAAAVGKKMTQLESEIGIQLFESGSSGMVPTAAGLFFYDRLDGVLWNLDSVIQQARNIPGDKDIHLNLGIAETLSGDSYRRVLTCFTAKHPDVALKIAAPHWKEMGRRLIDGRMDAAITYSIGLTDEPRLERKPLIRSKARIYYHEEMPVCHPEEISLDSFRESTFICLETDVAAMNMLRDLPFDPANVIFTENLKTLFVYVNAGIACTILGPTQQLAETYGIRSFVLSDMDYTMGIDLIWEKSNTNPGISLLIDCIDKVYPPIKQG